MLHYQVLNKMNSSEKVMTCGCQGYLEVKVVSVWKSNIQRNNVSNKSV